MLINIDENRFNRGVLLILEAIGRLPKGELAEGLADFYHDLIREQKKSIEIEFQEYNDATELMECLLDPTLNVPKSKDQMSIGEYLETIPVYNTPDDEVLQVNF